MFPRQTTSSSTTVKGLLVQNTAEQEEYRKRTLAIQRELRAMAVSLSANRRRFLQKRAELIRRSASVPAESSSGLSERRSADEERGNAAVRALSAVLERPRSEDRQVDTRQNAIDEQNEDLDRDQSDEQQPAETAGEIGQISSLQPPGETQRARKDVFSLGMEYVSETIEGIERETADETVSWNEKSRRYSRTSSVTETVGVDDKVRPVVNRRKMSRGPYERSTRSGSVSVTVAPPPPLKSEEPAVISRRMRGMTIGATEQLDLSRLRQICDARVSGAHSPEADQEHENMENTQQRIKEFLERASADSVVSDPSDLASESGSSSLVVQRPLDRRRSVSRVYALERSPRLRKRSVPSKPAVAINEEEEEELDSKDKLRLPPLSLPPVHSNVPLKLLPRNFSKRGHYFKESTRIWTAEEWEDLKHCRYLRNKPIP